MKKQLLVFGLCCLWFIAARPKALAQGPVDSLARQLAQGTARPEEKVQAIYRWLARNIAYDWDAYERRANSANEPLNVLKRRKAVCEGFSKLFKILCDKSGIENEIVHGFVKGIDFSPGQPVNKPNHTWNAVKIKGQWLLVDPTWGVNQFAGEFYCFVAPADLIYTHYPEDAAWQLLPDTVSLYQFERLPMVYPAFFEMAPRPLKYRQSLISTNADTLHVAFRIPPGAQLSAELSTEGTQRDLQGQVRYPRPTLANIGVDSLQKGKLYRLDVFGALTDTARVFDLLCTYFINTGRYEANYTTQPNSRLLTDSTTGMPFGFVNEYIDIQQGGSKAALLAHLQKGARRYADRPWLYAALGDLYDEMNDAPKAEQAYLQAVQLSPKYYRANYSLGVLYYNQAVTVNNRLHRLKNAEQAKANQQMIQLFGKAQTYLGQADLLRPGNQQIKEALREIKKVLSGRQ